MRILRLHYATLYSPSIRSEIDSKPSAYFSFEILIDFNEDALRPRNDYDSELIHLNHWIDVKCITVDIIVSSTAFRLP